MGQHASDTRGVSFEDVAVPEEVSWEEWERDEAREGEDEGPHMGPKSVAQ